MKSLTKIYLLLLLVLSLLALVSERSGYSIQGDVETMNFDVALMLTPWGMIHNLLLQPDHYLRPYYFELGRRGELFSDFTLLALVLATGTTVSVALIFFRRSRS